MIFKNGNRNAEKAEIPGHKVLFIFGYHRERDLKVNEQREIPSMWSLLELI